MQPTTAQHMMGGLRKIKDTVVSHDSVILLTVVIVVDDVGGFKSNGPTIIGLPTCRALKLVTLNYAMHIGPIAERDTDTTADVPCDDVDNGLIIHVKS